MKSNTIIGILIGAGITLIVGSALILDNKGKQEWKAREQLVLPPAPENPRNWDFQKQQWNTYNPNVTPKSHNYSDQEIRDIREIHSYNSNGTYIRTPGRKVRTLEKEVERYIDKHGEELYEELRDYYGD